MSNPMTVFDESIQRMDMMEMELVALREEITKLEEGIANLKNGISEE